ncbi:MAG: TIGR01777 family protein [Phycisphaeraceae bacterium]|nr:MAG: TIGR01777 family protein [Phycisphaeraceae bacterium]
MQSPKPTGKVVIAGGSGYLGLNLARRLCEHGCEVVILSRRPPRESGPWRHVPWDARTVGAWASELEGAAGLVNLAGRSVDCVKTPDHCDEILRSRVEPTIALGMALKRIDAPPPVWVQMSTSHIYGDPPELVCDESSPFGYGLAPFVASAWEDAAAAAAHEGVRRVVLRTSFVMGRDGGFLPRLAKVARLGFGGRVGHGRQGLSWIHERDMNRIFERALAEDSMQGVYVTTAPNPVSNAEFMRTLRRAIGAPIGLPATAWMVRIGAPLFMRTDPELAIYGRYCVPARLEREGFEFEFSDLESAMRDIYNR